MQTAYSLSQVAHGGVIHEDVMNRIFSIDPTDLPLQERIGTESVGNTYASWRIRDLAAPDPTSAEIDGSDSAQDDTRTGNRVGNFAHIKRKKVKTSTLADAVDTIGYSVEHTDQIMERQKELRRDVESAKLYVNPSQEDNGNDTPGIAASLSSWLTTHTNRGAGGADGGFGATTPNIVDAPTAGAERAASDTALRDLIEDQYTAGATPSVLMSIPKMIRRLSERWLAADARVATLQSDAGQASSAMTAKAAVNVFVSELETVLQLVPNRQQATYLSSPGAVAVCDLYSIAPEYLREGILRGYQSDMLGKTGLSETSEITVAFTLKCLNEKAHAVYADLDASQAVTA